MRLFSRGFTFGLAVSVAVGCASSTEPSSGPPAAHASFPQLVNGGGHLLTPLRLVVVVAANDALRDSLFAFATALPSSTWWRQVATPFGNSPTATAVTVTGPAIAPGTTMSFSDVTAYVQAAAIDGAGYRPDGRTMYLIWLPPNVTCAGTALCNQYTAFHAPFGTLDAIALVTRSQSGYRSVLEAMTTLASHEIIEAASDPELDAWRLVSPFLPWEGSPWGLDDGGSFEENADLCQGGRYQEGGFYYQRIFTNPAALAGGDPCAPAISTPYYNVTAANPWYATNGDVSIPLTGWSTAPVADWVIAAAAGPHTASLAAPTVSLSCTDTTHVNGAAYCTMNSGKVATLHITMPAGALSKAYATVRIFSVRFDAAGQRPPAGEDYSHRWMLGVYVP